MPNHTNQKFKYAQVRTPHAANVVAIGAENAGLMENQTGSVCKEGK